MVYDSQCDRIILFGGEIDGMNLMSDTWAYDYKTNTWTNMHPATGPPALRWHGMAYDSESDRVILYGGMQTPVGYGYSWDTWAYDYKTNTWTNMNPPASPRGADGPVMTYDSQSDRVILFGGWSGATSNDTWTYDFNTNSWTNLTSTEGPSARFGQGMAYDSRADRVILFGGTYDSRPQWGPGSAGTDTWAYDHETNSWTNMAPLAKPTARDGPGMDYDPVTDQVVLFGGLSRQMQTLGDLWSYQFTSNNWSRLDPIPAPSPRWYPTMVYDSQAGRFVLFGGLTATFPSNETWSFRTSPGSPSPPAPLKATPGDNAVLLEWQAPADDGGASITNYTIYRGTAAAGESLLLQLGNVLTYEDTDVTNGVTYYYQVTATNALGEGARAGEISVTPVPLPPDAIPPTVTIVSPSNNSILTSAAITVTGTAADNVAVLKVEVSLDETTWTLATGTTSWSVLLSLVEGDNTIHVRVTDTSGNTATSTVHVAVSTPSGPVGAEGIPVWVWPVVALASAGVAAAVYLRLRRRRKPAADPSRPPP